MSSIASFAVTKTTPARSAFELYAAKTPTSGALHQRAMHAVPSGVNHDIRCLKPHALYIARASGSRKWDVDGNEYVDYFGGHGSLILGHNHPVVVEAVREQLSRGTHFGASHESELLLAEQIRKMVPCAQKVRFTGSGTESTLLAIRLVRAFTGKKQIVRFIGHFHGWHDQVAFASISHFDGSLPPGIPPQVMDNAILCPPNDVAAITQILATRDDIAGVILEPTGSTFGQAPLTHGFLAQLRELTTQEKVPLIFDEVITGFRVAPGGAQQHYGITPDVAAFAKIMAGGYPGGAIAGRADIMDVMTVRDDSKWNTKHRVPHQGTFNANPITAAAGLATLKVIASTDVIQRADRMARLLRDQLNATIREEGMNWIAYGEFSGFHIFTDPAGKGVKLADIYSGKTSFSDLICSTPAPLMHKIRCGLIVGGADIVAWPGGTVSAVHTEQDIELTALAFKHLLRILKEEQTAAS